MLSYLEKQFHYKQWNVILRHSKKILKHLYFRFDCENPIVGKIPQPLPRQDITEVPQPPKENLRILCSVFSACGNFLAMADDHKQVTIWKCWEKAQPITLMKQCNLVRRANKLIFDANGHSVLIAGKLKVHS